MPKTPKEKEPAEPVEKDAIEESSRSEDQKPHSYYYDDAHGYQTYDPDADDELTAESSD